MVGPDIMWTYMQARSTMNCMVDYAWDSVLQESTPQDVASIRLVSQGWREDSGRALDSLHIVDPTPHMLADMRSHFPGLRQLSITLTHSWSPTPTHPHMLHSETSTSAHAHVRHSTAQAPTPPPAQHKPHPHKHQSGQQQKLQAQQMQPALQVHQGQQVIPGQQHLQSQVEIPQQGEQRFSGFLPWLSEHPLHVTAGTGTACDSRHMHVMDGSGPSCDSRQEGSSITNMNHKGALSQLRVPTQAQGGPHCREMVLASKQHSLKWLRELSVQGWVGTCTACKAVRQLSKGQGQLCTAHSSSSSSSHGTSGHMAYSSGSSSSLAGQGDTSSSDSSSSDSGNGVAVSSSVLPVMSESLLWWVAGSQQLHVLRLTRCELPNATFLQAYPQLRELHLVNVTLQLGDDAVAAHMMKAETEDSTASLLVHALEQLPHLHTLVLQQLERGLNYQGLSVHGLSRLQQLATLRVWGAPLLLLNVATQVPSCLSLTSLTLEAVPQLTEHQGSSEGAGGLELVSLLAAMLTAMQPGGHMLQRLHVVGHTHVDDRDLRHIAALFPSLTHVCLPLSSLAGSLTAWGHPPGGVTLEGLHSLLVKRTPQCSSALQNYTHLHQHSWQQTTSTQLSGYVADIRHAPLQGLHLAHVPLSKDVLRAVCMHTSLRELDLSGCPHVDDSIMYYMSSAPVLVKLGLSSCKALTDIGVAQLAVRAPQLTYLDISHPGPYMTDLGISRLNVLQHLTHLNLASCYTLSDKGIASLISGQHACLLETLTLSHCQGVSDVTLDLLSKRALRLTRLVLDGLTNITPAGIMRLAALKHLKSVSLAWCNSSIQGAAMALAKAIWGVRIGPLCTIPPGRIEAAQMYNAGDEQVAGMGRSSSTASSTSLASRTSTATHVGAQQHQACASNSDSNDMCATVVASGNVQASRGDVTSSSGSEERGCLKFRVNQSVVGFWPLDEPTAVLPAPCWWIDNSL